MIAILLTILSGCARAQQPFDTDDTDVVDRGKWHFETYNQLDLLQHAALPSKRQNTWNFKFSYGIYKNVEIGADNQMLTIFNAPDPVQPRVAFGYGDMDLSVKWNLYKEKFGHRMPALGVNLNIEFPTGNDKKLLGSGLTDYYLYGIIQKSVTERIKLRANAGVVFAGNTQTGVVGIRSRGTVFTGAASVVRDFTKRLRLGTEVTGAASTDFDLQRGQLQNKTGGNYKLKDNLSLDFALTAGKYIASPRLGAQIGFSVDFK